MDREWEQHRQGDAELDGMAGGAGDPSDVALEEEGHGRVHRQAGRVQQDPEVDPEEELEDRDDRDQGPTDGQPAQEDVEARAFPDAVGSDQEEARSAR